MLERASSWRVTVITVLLPGAINWQLSLLVDDEIVPQLRPEKDIWNLSNDDFYDPKAKADKSGKGGHGVLQHSTPGAAHYVFFLIIKI